MLNQTYWFIGGGGLHQTFQAEIAVRNPAPFSCLFIGTLSPELKALILAKVQFFNCSQRWPFKFAHVKQVKI